ncbi:MAG: hypothetical protein WDN01_12210 [Rhizomicrobium sp.]
MRLPLSRSAAISLALCAMVLRALLPDGWMPAAAGSPFVICSVDGTHTGGKAPAAPAREHSHAPCAFAAAAPLAPPQITAFAGPIVSKAPTLAFAGRAEPFDSRAFHRPNAPRAPPSFS